MKTIDRYSPILLKGGPRDGEAPKAINQRRWDGQLMMFPTSQGKRAFYRLSVDAEGQWTGEFVR